MDIAIFLQTIERRIQCRLLDDIDFFAYISNFLGNSIPVGIAILKYGQNDDIIVSANPIARNHFATS